VDPSDPRQSLGTSAMNRLVYFHLAGQSRPIMRALDEESDEALARRCLAKWPLLPVTNLTVGETPLVDLLYQPPKEPVKQTLTQGQVTWRERKKRQAFAERHRQHWIDKDNAKRKKTPPSR
jgi:hypothetical protein